jgi:hypothetical protein
LRQPIRDDGPVISRLSLSDEFDSTVFGVLKAQAKGFFHVRFGTNPYGRRRKHEVVADMITVWSMLGASVIEKACDIYT